MFMCLFSLHGVFLNSHAHVQLCESWLGHGIAKFQNFRAEDGGRCRNQQKAHAKSFRVRISRAEMTTGLRDAGGYSVQLDENLGW